MLSQDLIIKSTIIIVILCLWSAFSIIALNILCQIFQVKKSFCDRIDTFQKKSKIFSLIDTPFSKLTQSVKNHSSTCLKVIFPLFLIVIWFMTTLYAISAISYAINIEKIDTKALIIVLKKRFAGLIPNPFEKVIDVVKEETIPVVSLDFVDGMPMDMEVPKRIDANFFKDRKHYSLNIINNSKEIMHQMEWRIQLPYPIESYSIKKESNAINLQLRPTMSNWTTVVGKGGTIEWKNKPMYDSYFLTIDELRQQGFVKVSIVLSSRWDPRGKEIPENCRARYHVPEVNPSLTYINATYKLNVEGEELNREYYVHAFLNEKMVVMLGEPTNAPEKLTKRTGIIF